MKTYKIGEIAKILGISPETIRNYEKKGIIRPYKEEDSHYRYFDIIQINHLLNLQKYQKYGYHLQDIKDIMNEHTMHDVYESLMTQEQILMNEAFYLNLKLNSVHATMSCMIEAQHAKQGCFLGTRPALYRLSYQRNRELIQDKRVQEELTRWLKYADLPFMSGSASIEVMMNQGEEFDFGFCLDQHTAEFIGVRESDIVTFYESCPAILFYYEATESTDMAEISKMVVDFARENQLEICGESVSRVIFARWNDYNDYMLSHLVWVPYRKMNTSND